MPKTPEYLQPSQLTKRREQMANLLSGINGLTVIEQTGMIDYELWCDKGRELAEGLAAKGIPAGQSGGKKVFIFSPAYPFYAQNRIGINKVAKEIIRIVTDG